MKKFSRGIKKMKSLSYKKMMKIFSKENPHKELVKKIKIPILSAEIEVIQKDIDESLEGLNELSLKATVKKLRFYYNTIGWYWSNLGEN